MHSNLQQSLSNSVHRCVCTCIHISIHVYIYVTRVSLTWLSRPWQVNYKVEPTIPSLAKRNRWIQLASQDETSCILVCIRPTVFSLSLSLSLSLSFSLRVGRRNSGHRWEKKMNVDSCGSCDWSAFGCDATWVRFFATDSLVGSTFNYYHYQGIHSSNILLIDNDDQSFGIENDLYVVVETPNKFSILSNSFQFSRTYILNILNKEYIRNKMIFNKSEGR